MEKHIADILPYATAVALSPMPIAALILMLLSNRAKVNSIAFSFGWILGLATLVFFVKYLVLLTGSNTQQATGVTPATIIHFAVGAALIGFAIKEWKLRPKLGAEPKMPGWMNAVESFTPIKALAVGFALATVNLKNTPMGITVGAVISDAGSAGSTVLIVYLILASCTITVPTIGFLLLGKKLEPKLEKLKAWLIGNNATIMFVLFLILGVVILSKAFGG